LPKGVSVAQITDLAKGDYLRGKANVIAIGGSDTGKSHVCIGLAVEACRKNQRARFYTAVDLISELEEAQEQHLLRRFLKRFAAWDVVVVDELGYLPLTERGAELLFQAFSARHEHGSIILNSNLASSPSANGPRCSGSNAWPWPCSTGSRRAGAPSCRPTSTRRAPCQPDADSADSKRRRQPSMLNLLFGARSPTFGAKRGFTHTTS
jgi:hypothetical protein